MVLEARLVRELEHDRIEACLQACLERRPGWVRCGRRNRLRESAARSQGQSEPQDAKTRIPKRDRDLKPWPGFHDVHPCQIAPIRGKHLAPPSEKTAV